ncbi:MAG: hypothetical protein ACD_4C00185G0007 [uncultured bacterium (gcode 4)]|uniref:DUF559 domain-containing protein n=1 Tax=uncultured bacterium (gcode 4) TaxID=1234023 RepID=K2G994_9BACT|nr:MAG: hypothetical protein ACD_4C00185G0007 [uncultured bacterium (gcode 4)]
MISTKLLKKIASQIKYGKIKKNFMDKFTTEKRSEIMSKIKGKDTKIEFILRRALFKAWLRWYRIQKRVHWIRPDIIYIWKKVAIFMDWCFWHWCPQCFKAPESNKEYWWPKIETNINRDIKNTLLLKSEWWTVLRFWEHEVKRDLEGVVGRIKKILG